jgi:hypothetical protein
MIPIGKFKIREKFFFLLRHRCRSSSEILLYPSLSMTCFPSKALSSSADKNFIESELMSAPKAYSTLENHYDKHEIKAGMKNCRVKKIQGFTIIIKNLHS